MLSESFASSPAASLVSPVPSVVCVAALETPEMFVLISPTPLAASETLRAISFVVALCSSTALAIVLEISFILLIIAGLLVGFGTRISGGCTSGHGISGISRFSLRSLIATITFMIVGVITVLIKNYL